MATATQTLPEIQQKSGPVSPARRSPSFNFYIHDRVSDLRLELMGDFLPGNVTDLRGVWQTASSTLGKRKLILDLRHTQILSQEAEQWLTEMEKLGASIVKLDP